jgi:Protein of unknown function (DUF3352)
MKQFLLSAVAVASFGAAQSVAQAQTLSKFAPANAIAAIEINDYAGVRKQSAALAREIEKLDLGSVVAEAMGSSTKERQELEASLSDFTTLVDREGFVAVYLSAKTNQIGYLMAARPAVGSDAKIKAWTQRTVRETKARSTRVSNFPVFTSTMLNFGYEGGLAYVASDLTTLGEFLGRFRNEARYTDKPSLSGSSTYSEIVGGVGAGNLRFYVDLRNVSQLARGAIDMIDPDLPGIKLEPLLDSVTTLGRFGASWKVTSEGIENTTLLVPEKRGADVQFAKLLTPNDKLELRAADVVPASAVAFSTSSSNPQAFYSWLSNLADRTGAQPGGLDAFFKQEFKIDAQKSLLSWMTGELASATFVGKGTLQALGESVTYIGTKDPAATERAIETVLPKLIEVGQRLAQQKVNSKITKTKLGAVNIYRVPMAENLPLVAAVKDGFLMIATSDTAITAALASGPRLESSASYKSAVARVPKDALGWGYGDTTTSLKSAASASQQVLEIALTASLDLRPSTSRKLSAAINGLLNGLANRAGFAVNWTEVVSSGTKTRSFQPMKW